MVALLDLSFIPSSLSTSYRTDAWGKSPERVASRTNLTPPRVAAQMKCLHHARVPGRRLTATKDGAVRPPICMLVSPMKRDAVSRFKRQRLPHSSPSPRQNSEKRLREAQSSLFDLALPTRYDCRLQTAGVRCHRPFRFFMNSGEGLHACSCDRVHEVAS